MADQPQTPGAGEADARFLYLVWSLASAAWAQLGKIPHPVTNKIERDLDQAKMSIDYLRMLKEKTAGNLKPKEQELLNSTVADLELNFADENTKETKPATGAPEIVTPAGGAAGKGPEIIRP